MVIHTLRNRRFPRLTLRKELISQEKAVGWVMLAVVVAWYALYVLATDGR